MMWYFHKKMNNYGNENNGNIKLQQNLLTFRTILQNFYGSSEINILNFSLYYSNALKDFKLNFKELRVLLVTQHLQLMVNCLKEELAILGSERLTTQDCFLQQSILSALELHFRIILKFIYRKITGDNPDPIDIDQCFFTFLKEEIDDIMAYKTRKFFNAEVQLIGLRNFRNEDSATKLLNQNLINFRIMLQKFYRPHEITSRNYCYYYDEVILNFQKNLIELHEILLSQDLKEMLKLIKDVQFNLDLEWELIQACKIFRDTRDNHIGLSILIVMLVHLNEIVDYLEIKIKGDNLENTLEKIDKRFFTAFSDETSDLMSYKTRIFG